MKVTSGWVVSLYPVYAGEARQTPSPGVEAAWIKEIERRVHELDSGKVEAVPWEDVEKRLLAQEQHWHES